MLTSAEHFGRIVSIFTHIITYPIPRTSPLPKYYAEYHIVHKNRVYSYATRMQYRRSLAVEEGKAQSQAKLVSADYQLLSLEIIKVLPNGKRTYTNIV